MSGTDRQKKALKSMEDAANASSPIDDLARAFQNRNSQSNPPANPSYPSQRDPNSAGSLQTAKGYSDATGQLASDETGNSMKRLNDLNDQMDWASNEDKPGIQKQINDVKANFPKVSGMIGN